MKITTTYAILWIAVSSAVIAGLYFTKNANCLWGFLIPALMGITSIKEK